MTMVEVLERRASARGSRWVSSGLLGVIGGGM